MLQSTDLLSADDLVALRPRENLAIDELAHWSGHPADLRTLRITAAVARLLVAEGYGADALPELDKADAVLRQRRANPPGITGVAQADLAALRWLLAFADGQRAVVSTRDHVQALERVRQDPGRYGVWLV